MKNTRYNLFSKKKGEIAKYSAAASFRLSNNGIINQLGNVFIGKEK